MFVYPVRAAFFTSFDSKRVSLYHSLIYHGLTGYVGVDLMAYLGMSLEWDLPALTNSNRDLAHISRSGRYVPEIFGDTFGTLHVSEKIRDACSGVDGVEFNPVVFEKLVDLSMPPIGDFSWENKNCEIDGNGRYPEAEDELHMLPDRQEFHKSMPLYFSMLTHRLKDLHGVTDTKKITVDWGSYREPTFGKTVWISPSALQQYPVLTSGTTYIFREDVFEIIAPFLNLDYFLIACVHFD